MEDEIGKLAREYIGLWNNLHDVARKLNDKMNVGTVSVELQTGIEIDITPRHKPDFNEAPAFIRKVHKCKVK